MMEDGVVKEAVTAAAAHCQANGILPEFFSNLTPEDVNMIAMEFSIDFALEAARAEALAEGIKKGKEKAQNYVLELLDKGYSTEEIRKHLTS
jgi:tellurite resistance protein